MPLHTASASAWILANSIVSRDGEKAYTPDQWPLVLSHSRRICRSKASSCDRDSRSIPEVLFGITVCQPSPSSAMAAKSGSDWGALGNRWRISDELAKIAVRSDESVGSGYHPQDTKKPWSLRRRRKEKRYLLRHNPSPSTGIEESKEKR